MQSATRVAALILAASALLLLPAVGSATSPSKLLFQSKISLSSRVSCKKTGLSGPTGAISVFIYALKGKHPSKSALQCSRGIAIVKAGKSDLFSKLFKSEGKKFNVQGTSYTLYGFIGEGASGVTPAFVGANTAVLASYATTR
jgi:hypothetical protein